jgi:hypothetical protein
MSRFATNHPIHRVSDGYLATPGQLAPLSQNAPPPRVQRQRTKPCRTRPLGLGMTNAGRVV